MVKFDVTSHENQTIAFIVSRAAGLLATHAHELKYSRMEIYMDVTACHTNGNPLRLEELMNAKSDYEFMHDVLGIRKHIDRTTGKLDGIFTPRFSQS
jgi:hypothetical protein